jgi:iron complex transport system ATP-binding protein
MRMGDPIIRVLDYSLQLGGRTILKDVSLTVEKGDYLCIIGPNGAGKTTLLKCLDGIYRKGEGKIEIKGRPLKSYSQKELAKLVSYVPQADGASFPFTVKEFVLMGRYPYLSPFSPLSRLDKEATFAALEATGTMEFADRYLDTLSGGERQKVFIAAALSQGAEMILLDEPTAFLDPKHEEEICRILARTNHESASTIISVTHDVNQAILLSRRIVALKQGSVVFCGPSQEIVEPGILEQLYERSFRFLTHPETGRPFVLPELSL